MLERVEVAEVRISILTTAFPTFDRLLGVPAVAKNDVGSSSLAWKTADDDEAKDVGTDSVRLLSDSEPPEVVVIVAEVVVETEALPVQPEVRNVLSLPTAR